MSEAALIARVLADDDRHAYGELVRRYQSAVRGTLRRLTSGDHAWADDLAQDTFLKAHRGLGQYRGGARLGAWLMRIAYHAYVSDARARPIGEPTIDDVLEGEAPADDVLLRADLERAMECLSAPQRAALALTFGQDVSHEEAAAILEWPLGTLKTHVARAKQRLKARLQDYEGGSSA